MILAIHAEVIAASNREFGICIRDGTERKFVLELRFARENVKTYATNARGRTGEIGVHQSFIQPDRFEDLRATITLQRRNTHLRECLEQTFIYSFDEVLHRNIGSHAARQITSGCQVFQRLDRKIRIDRTRAVPDQQSEVHDFSRLSRFDNQRHLSTGFVAHK